MNKGFSLVELSIVLVILGLLTGGVLTGKQLIEAAELRAASAEIDEYRSAVMAFRSKYFAIPGDMRNATAFWGEHASCGGNNLTDIRPLTCNGDGDGVLRVITTDHGTAGDIFLFWQHLSYAEMVSGSFTGVSGTDGATSALPGTNVPESRYGSGVWGVDDRPGSDNYNFAPTNILELGANVPGGDADGPLLTPADAYQIDKKIDDGLPAKGRVLAKYWNNQCGAADDGTHAPDDLEAHYRVEDPTIQCSLVIRGMM